MSTASTKKIGGSSNECVQVVVRCRPMNSKEKAENRTGIVDTDSALGQVTLRNPDKDQEPKRFTFDASYDENITQRLFYEESCYPLVESVIEGFNGTIFAYGQTGCGKTHTMMGLNDPPELRGVIPNSFDHIFETIRANTGTMAFLVRCSFLEIYNEEIRDLLGTDPKAKYELKEDPNSGVFVKDLTNVVVQDEASMNALMEKGVANRTVGATLMNQGSSRSHSIFTITIETSQQNDGRDLFKAGKLNLVDLAGSERQAKTGATGERLKEGCKINLSLSALGNVISALADGKGKHIPYRDSKLTRLLQDSLGGNTRTLMVAAVSPADYNYDETLSTLRYANRAKNIKNKPKINEDPKDTLLREYQNEIQRLKQMLEAAGAGQPMDAAVLKTTMQQLSPKAAVASAVQQQQPQQLQQLQEQQVEIKEKIVEVVKERVVEVAVEKERIVHVEVTSKVLLEEKEALAQLNQALISNRDHLGEELEKEKAYREYVEQQLAEMQSRIIGDTQAHAEEEGAGGETGGADKMQGNPQEDPSVIVAKKNVEQRKLMQKLKAKKRREAKLEAERRKAVDEKAEVEEELKSAQEQSEVANKKLAKIKARMERKIKQARDEIEDLSTEFEREREGLLDSLRDAHRDVKLWEQVVAMLLPQKAISKIWEKAVWDGELEEWRLPRIKAKATTSSNGNKPVKLPNLGASPGSSDSNVERLRTADAEDRAPHRRPSSSAIADSALTHELSAVVNAIGDALPNGEYARLDSQPPERPVTRNGRSGGRKAPKDSAKRGVDDLYTEVVDGAGRVEGGECEEAEDGTEGGSDLPTLQAGAGKERGDPMQSREGRYAAAGTADERGGGSRQDRRPLVPKPSGRGLTPMEPSSRCTSPIPGVPQRVLSEDVAERRGPSTRLKKLGPEINVNGNSTAASTPMKLSPRSVGARTPVKAGNQSIEDVFDGRLEVMMMRGGGGRVRVERDGGEEDGDVLSVGFEVDEDNLEDEQVVVATTPPLVMPTKRPGQLQALQPPVPKSLMKGR